MDLEPVDRLSRDLAKASISMSKNEVRFLVDNYYIMQRDRTRTDNQARSMMTEDEPEPHEVLIWFSKQASVMEGQLKRALDQYSDADPVGAWMREVKGIGPVLAAGLLAHIDIEKAPTVGHIWRYAGYDPTVKWEKGQKRPWNASLKTLCWKIGQSFMKLSNDEECYYGKVYKARKEYEIARNERGGNQDLAEAGRARVGKNTEAFKHYAAGRLPPGQIDARSRRYAVKLFLSHLHGVWYEQHYHKPPPLPYPIAYIPGHTHIVGRPH